MYDNSATVERQRLSGWAIVAVLAAGFVAGSMNAVVGSGSLLTFPVLLSLGYAPLVANVTNTTGLAFGNITAVLGYRRELEGQRDRLVRLVLPALGGAVAGSALLLTLPQRVFAIVVPPLIILAVVLVILQPWLRTHLRRTTDGGLGVLLPVGVFAAAMYGGYFGAAQGVIYMSLFGILLTDSLQRLNGLKNVIALLVNGAAAIIFALLAHVSWEPALLIAGSSIAGGHLGATFGRRLPPAVLRGLLVVAGIAALVKLVF